MLDNGGSVAEVARDVSPGSVKGPPLRVLPLTGSGCLQRRQGDGARSGAQRSSPSVSASGGRFGGGAGGGFLAAPVALAVEGQLVGGGLEPVDGGLGEQAVGHESEPLDRLPVGGHDGGCLAVPLHDDLEEVGGVGGVEGLEAEIVKDQ